MKRQQCLIILVGIFTIAFGQKVAPGVPPQHYMDPSLQHNQHYQQVPQMQYVQPGQPQVQQQMPPVQQPVQHVPAPVAHQQIPQMNVQHDPNMHHQQQLHQQQQQQQPMGGAPHQGHHRLPQQVLDTTNIQGEKAHIQEHFDVPIDTSKMTEQELQFHYFKMHDSDQNNKLDGCELIKSLIHWHEKSNKDAAHHGHEGAHQEKIFSDEELVALIDPILAMDDTGKDGYIDYPEFIKAQQKAAAQNKAEKP